MADGKVVEQVADQLEEVADVTRHLNGREVGFFFAGAGIGVAAGFAVGYFVMSKRLETKYQKFADDEIAEMREHYRNLTVALKGEAERRRPLEELLVEKGYVQGDDRYDEAEQRAIAEVNARFPEDGPGEGDAQDSSSSQGEQDEEGADSGSHERSKEAEAVTGEIVHNVFEQDEVTVWDYAVETKNRKSDVPYIIHIDEFRESDPPFEKVTYTYYEDDDVLSDSRDDIIEDMDAVIGLGNLGCWGHGSGDPNIVYVRNEELRIDAEIIRDRGSFHDTVHSIRHSAVRRRPHG